VSKPSLVVGAACPLSHPTCHHSLRQLLEASTHTVGASAGASPWPGTRATSRPSYSNTPIRRVTETASAVSAWERPG